MRNKTTEQRRYGSPARSATNARKTSTKKSAKIRLTPEESLRSEYEEYIKDLTVYFVQLLGFTEYQIKVHFLEGPHEDKAAAEIDVLKNYESAAISVYEKPMLDLYKSKDYWQLANIMCHEVCHIITQDMKDAAWSVSGEAAKEHLNNLNERQTTRTAKTIMKLVPEDIYTP